MTGQAPFCDDQQLLRMLRIDSDNLDSGAMLDHIENCERCQHRLDELAADESEWLKTVEVLSSNARDAATDGLEGFYPSLHTSRIQLRQPAWTESMARQLLSPPSHPEMLGRIGRYDVERLIGSGGMGVVFKTYDTALNRPVAVKLLAPYLASSGAARNRFAREARAAAAVVDDHVVPIHNVETEDEHPFLVMKYIAGGSLQQRLDREGPLDVCEVLRIGMQTAKGLAAAHAQGLVHRDVKPANILLTDGVERVKLTDFGLARAADDASLTKTGIIAGTPQFMSPEQARGESVDQRSDLFSLGCVLYAMCTGRPPFRAETSYGVLRRITDEEPRPIREINPDIPDWLCRIIARLMAKQPDDRFQSAREVAQLLEECLAHVQQPHLVPLPQCVEQLSQLLSPAGAGRNEQLGQLFYKTAARPRNLFARTVPLVLAAALSFVLIFAGVLIVLQWNKGTLTIESDADNVPVRITQGDESVDELTVTKTGTSVRMAAGRYQVELLGEYDGLAVENGTFTLSRGGEQVVRIRHVAEADPIPPSRPFPSTDLPPPTPAWDFDPKRQSAEATERAEEYIDTLNQRVKAAEDAYQRGSITRNRVMRARLDLLEAQLELVNSVDKRISLLEKQVPILTHFELEMTALYKDGAVLFNEVLAARAERIAAEMRLQRERDVQLGSADKPAPRDGVRRSELWALDDDGQNLRRVADCGEYTIINSPEVSPDGKFVAVDGWRANQNLRDAHVLIINVETGETSDLCEGAMPTWSPDGKWISFCKYGSERGVYIRALDGGAERLLDRDGWGIQWSPAGLKAAYSRGGRLVVHNFVSDTERVINPADWDYTHIYWNTTWSPDSKQICFKARRRTGQDEFAIVSVDGDMATVKRRINAKDFNEDIAWHPGGSRILIPRRAAKGEHAQICEFDPDGTDEPVSVKGQPKDRNQAGMCWTRDGKTLYFISQSAPESRSEVPGTDRSDDAAGAANSEMPAQLRLFVPDTLGMLRMLIRPSTLSVSGNTSAPVVMENPERIATRTGHVLQGLLSSHASELFLMIEVASRNPVTMEFLKHNAIPVKLTQEDIDQANTGFPVRKIVYLPNPNLTGTAVAEAETIVSTRLDPGLDLTEEARKRGETLATIVLSQLRRNASGTDRSDALRNSGGAPQLEGTVLSVSEGLGELSLGYDDGVRKGQRFHVFDGRTYVGRVDVIRVETDKAIVRIDTDDAQRPIRRGDRVTTHRKPNSSSVRISGSSDGVTIEEGDTKLEASSVEIRAGAISQESNDASENADVPAAVDPPQGATDARAATDERISVRVVFVKSDARERIDNSDELSATDKSLLQKFLTDGFLADPPAIDGVEQGSVNFDSDLVDAMLRKLSSAGVVLVSTSQQRMLSLNQWAKITLPALSSARDENGKPSEIGWRVRLRAKKDGRVGMQLCRALDVAAEGEPEVDEPASAYSLVRFKPDEAAILPWYFHFLEEDNRESLVEKQGGDRFLVVQLADMPSSDRGDKRTAQGAVERALKFLKQQRDESQIRNDDPSSERPAAGAARWPKPVPPQQPFCVVRGMLADRDGKPIPNKPVWIVGMRDGEFVLYQDGPTKTDGSFEFDDVPANIHWRFFIPFQNGPEGSASGQFKLAPNAEARAELVFDEEQLTASVAVEGQNRGTP